MEILEVAGPPPSVFDLPTFQPNPEICGICGETKIRLVTHTTYKQCDVWLCSNIPKGEKMPCDGAAYKHYVRNFSDLVA